MSVARFLRGIVADVRRPAMLTPGESVIFPYTWLTVIVELSLLCTISSVAEVQAGERRMSSVRKGLVAERLTLSVNTPPKPEQPVSS